MGIHLFVEVLDVLAEHVHALLDRREFLLDR
jgi:hypothetical protein